MWNKYKYNDKPFNHYEGWLLTTPELLYINDDAVVNQKHVCTGADDVELCLVHDDPAGFVQYHQNITADDVALDFVFSEIYPTYEEGGFLFVRLQEKKPVAVYVPLHDWNMLKWNAPRWNEGISENAMFGDMFRFSLEPIAE